jgi:hypothetical protein
MAFDAGIKRPQQSQGNQNNMQQNSFDRLLTVVSYDTAQGTILTKDDRDNKDYEIFVNPDEVYRADQALKEKAVDISGINWMGHKIDKGMERNIPVKSKLIALRTRFIEKNKQTGITRLEIHRIGGVPNPEPDKTFQGIFTMTYRMDEGLKRLSRVQHWNPTSIRLSEKTEDKLMDLKAKIDEARADYGTKIGEYNVTKPTIGVQFRAIIKTDRLYSLNERAIYEAIDTSNPIDWIPGPEDENGKEIKTEAHPLTGEEMLQYAQMYIDYIQSDDQFKNYLNEIAYEVCFYHVYPASRNDNLLLTTGNPQKDKNADKNPLYQLSHRQSYVDMAHSENGLIVGRNAAVNGIIQLSGNKLAKVDGKPVEIPSYWVSKLHANNTRGHVHSFIRSIGEDGLEYKVEPHKNLQLIKDEKQQNYLNNKNQEAASGNSSYQAHEPASEPAPSTVSATPSTPLPKDNEFDPFNTPDFDVTPSVEEKTTEGSGDSGGSKSSGSGLRFGSRS